MMYGTLIVEKKEYATLQRLISQTPQKADGVYSSSVNKLSQELELAFKVNEDEMPDEVVRFNSLVTINLPKSINKTFQLVAPESSDISQNKVSILAPMGLALFGYAQGDEVLWEFPSGMNKIKIVKVEQVNANVC